MSIVVPTDFIGEVNIPNSGDTYLGTTSNIQYFIDKYTPEFLEMLWGYVLYQQYLAGITLDPIDAKWVNLQNAVKPLLLNFIYYYFKRDEYTYSAGIGESQSKGENSTMVSPGFKMQSRWNEMVKWVFKMIKYWDVATYGDYYISFGIFRIYELEFQDFYPIFYSRCRRRLPDIFYTINTYGI